MIKNRLLLNKNTSLESVIQMLDENGNGILPVVDENTKLIGIITDGDFRRAILNNSKSVEDLVNKNPISMHYMTPKKQIINYLKSIHRRHLPLVDENGILMDVFSLDEVSFFSKTNKVVIMAGGLGSRLGELTKDMPKPMLKVGGRPILEHIINSFSSFGFQDIYISVNYKSEVIENYFGDGGKFGVNIRYIREDKRLGTAGALGLIKDELKEDAFFVINGDVMCILDAENLMNEHKKRKVSATVCTRQIKEQIAYGVLEIADGMITSISEKPVNSYYISAGIYVLEPNILKYIPENEYFDITTLFDMLIHNNEVVSSYEIDDYWIDIGKREDYLLALKEFSIEK